MLARLDASVIGHDRQSGRHVSSTGFGRQRTGSLKSLLLNGFDGIGLNAILQAAGVPKGSFYYFFKSKEHFASAVLDAYERQHFSMQ